jgi:hypothetical protein
MISICDDFSIYKEIGFDQSIDAAIDHSDTRTTTQRQRPSRLQRRELVAIEKIVGKDVAKKDTRKLLFGLRNPARHSFTDFPTPADYKHTREKSTFQTTPRT